MQQQKSMEKCRLTYRGWAQLWLKNMFLPLDGVLAIIFEGVGSKPFFLHGLAVWVPGDLDFKVALQVTPLGCSSTGGGDIYGNLW